MDHFASLKDRINLGIELYYSLFHQESSLENILSWSKAHPHFGSRSDYWPQLELPPGKEPALKVKDCFLAKGASRIYRPTLQAAWKEISHEKAELGDWFKNWRTVDYLIMKPTLHEKDMQSIYCKSLDQIQMFTETKEIIFR